MFQLWFVFLWVLLPVLLRLVLFGFCFWFVLYWRHVWSISVGVLEETIQSKSDPNENDCMWPVRNSAACADLTHAKPTRINPATLMASYCVFILSALYKTLIIFSARAFMATHNALKAPPEWFLLDSLFSCFRLFCGNSSVIAVIDNLCRGKRLPSLCALV